MDDQTKKTYKIPAEYSTKFWGKSDFETETLQLSAKTVFSSFFWSSPNFGEKTLQFLAKTFFFCLHSISATELRNLH